MSSTSILILLTVGLLAGVLSGLVGIGGGIIIVPALVYFLGMSQHAAQGSTLFMFMLPIGALGVLNYYNKGFVDYKVALIMGLTFILGSYLGSNWAISIDQKMLRRVFGAMIFLISIKLMLSK